MNGGDFKGFANSMLRDIVGVNIGNLCVDDQGCGRHDERPRKQRTRKDAARKAIEDSL